MTEEIRTRWDFIGLSTDTKPTKESSTRVVDGSTYYESDTSKLYVWYNDDWYEKKSQAMSSTNPTGSGTLSVNGEAIGEKSVALGNKTTAYGANSFAVGSSENKALDIVTVNDIENAVTNDNPDALVTAWETDKFNLSGGENSHAEGSNCLALGANSHAEGNGTIANHSSAHAEGTGCQATGKYSHAGGLETVASGQGSFAQGQRVKATGSGAIAMGYNESNFSEENARGRRAIAIGYNSVASGQESVAIGTGAWSSDSDRVAVGKYNENTSGSIFLVGNGSGPNSRSTAFYIDTNGKAYIKADLTGSENQKALVDLKYLREYAQEYLPNQTILTTSTQVNNAKNAGFYRVAFTYNLNGEYTYGEMISIPYKSTDSNNHYGAQLFFANGDYTDGRQNCFWYRTINGSTWNSWVKVDPTKFDLTRVTGYSSTGTQVLKNINGTIQWVNE